MKKWFVVPAVASMAMVGLFGCSSDTKSSAPEGLSENLVEETASYQAATFNVNTQSARTALARRSHSVLNQWEFGEDSLSADSVGYAHGSVDSTFGQGDYAVEASVKVDSDSAYTIASAGVDGDGAAWLLQIEEGNLVLVWRNQASDSSWHKIVADQGLKTGRWHGVRMEYLDSMMVFLVNGSVTGAYKYEKGLHVKGTFTIGYDLWLRDRCNCKGGQIDYVIIENSQDMFVQSSSSSEQKVVRDSVPAEEVAESKWIAAWEFNDASDVGRDFSGNGHDAIIKEGAVTVKDSVALFDGQSGFKVNLTPDLKINDFVIEARFNPASTSRFNNIVVAEPPGRYGDGWIFRLGNGVLYFNIRDAANGTDWTEFDIATIPMNQWTVARVERLGDEISFFVNDTLMRTVKFKGDVSDLAYDWGVGYDAMNQALHNRYFDGKIDYIRFGRNEESLEVVEDTVVADSSVADSVVADSVVKDTSGKTVVKDTANVKSAEWKLLAAWEFNDADSVGLDATEGGNDAYVGEGKPVVEDTVLLLDGKSGLVIPLSKTFQRNDFVVEARVMPKDFGRMPNIIVSEPPGFGVDGWALRADYGKFHFQIRDDRSGQDWTNYDVDTLALDEWNLLRVEVYNGTVKMFKNGELVLEETFIGDITQMGYDLAIGYDAMNQAFHSRYFNGKIDYIRFYGL